MPTTRRKKGSASTKRIGQSTHDKESKSPRTKSSQKLQGKTPRRSSTKRRVKITQSPRPRRPTNKLIDSETYVFECTRKGCGYHIWREEKAEPGQLRFDIKCPKCHNEEFRCMGKGDFPQSFSLPVSPLELDLGSGSVSLEHN
ncbi:hypothetical protein E6H23_10785 [Candidatus Bathyarchaeota archaeon]|nr:MAG: hypothetical protein E6H23_10785 [Candidatus Bathyarchaeota archaeon]